MKKILGLDLGVTSIGWALLAEEENKRDILAMGSRIIPLSTDDKDEFSSGNKISKNQKRTTRRTQRKGYDRYQLRRENLTAELRKFNMLPDESLIKLRPLELWGLRARGAAEKITLPELGRVLYHLNQKRGYKSSRSDANLDKKDTEYVAGVRSRHEELKGQGTTIGQKFLMELQRNENYRIKQQVYPREAYIEEFEVICKEQQKYYPEVITDSLIIRLKDEIIYYQRKLKSQKGLVGVCEFEGFWTKTKENKELFVGPKVAAKSSPLFQVCKIWEMINAITLKNKQGQVYEISIEKKKELFNYLDNNERLSQAELLKILGLNKTEWYGNKQTGKGLQGNITKCLLLKHLDKGSPLLEFNLITETIDEEVYLVDRKTGEIKGTTIKKVISAELERQPLYQLWHTIYSISDAEECRDALIKRFRLEYNLAQKLAQIDFTRFSFGNKSVKAMRKVFPYLTEGFAYSDAASFAGYNHSNSLTKDENTRRKLMASIPNLPKNSLRQPIVEKILNQLINLVNMIIEKHGHPDEIRVELARELKQSKDERNETFSNMSKRERENETIRKRIQDEYGLRATRNNVIKWRLFHEINNQEAKTNALCIYCGKSFGITDALRGSNVDVEHIIPKSLLFDDSQSNKTLSHRSCNETKGNQTAFDFMSGKGEQESNTYIERVDMLFKNKVIGKVKRDKLLMPAAKIPKDFIDRQLRETQYIARKAKEILEQVCYTVWSTSGSVTEHLRRIWGWDDVLMNLQLPKYQSIGRTEIKEWETNDGQRHKKEVIRDWSKRDDHRHHAIDALTIACTQQGFIQRINTLSSQRTKDEMYAEVSKQDKGFKQKFNLLDSYLVTQRPFTTKQVEEKAAGILVSFKAGKKVATVGKRKVKKNGRKEVVQAGIIVPRGALSEESVYGKIMSLEKQKPVKYLFENPQLIFKLYIKALVEGRLKQFDNDPKKALASLKKEPLYLDEQQTKILEYGTCYKEEYVIKYPLEGITAKHCEFIIDHKIRSLVKERLQMHGNKEKEAFKEPLYLNEEKKIRIRSVRMFTGLSAVEPVKKDEHGKDIGFVKPGNNHHIAIYSDEKGKKQEYVCSFWHAVERRKYGIPVILEDPKRIWEMILTNKHEYPESFLEKLPSEKWKFEMSLQQNEMFILGMEPEILKKALTDRDKKAISSNLFRVQKLAYSDYFFRHHLETQVIESEEARAGKRYYRCKSVGSFEKLNPRKIRLNNLGEIISEIPFLTGVPIDVQKSVEY